MIRQHMSLSHEKAEWWGSIWVFHMRKLNDQAAYEFIFFPLWHEKVKWSGSMWVCHMRMQYDQAAYKFFVVSLTWGCRITKQCLEFVFSSHENAEWSGSIWVCLMRKWCYQAAYECLMRKWYYQAAFEFVSWESGVIRQHMSLSHEKVVLSGSIWVSHEKVVLSGSIWVCLMRKWCYQAAYEFVSWESGIIRQHLSVSWESGIIRQHLSVSWESGIIRQHLSLSHEKVVLSGSIWVCLMRKWYYQAAYECLMRKWCYQAAYEFVSWESGIIRQHQSLFLSHSHEDVDWPGSVLSSFFCPTHMRVLHDQAAYEFYHMKMLNGQVASDFVFCPTPMKLLNDQIAYSLSHKPEGAKGSDFVWICFVFVPLSHENSKWWDSILISTSLIQMKLIRKMNCHEKYLSWNLTVFISAVFY